MYIANHYRGRITLTELLHLDIGIVMTLNKMAYDEQQDPNYQKNQGASIIEDAIMGNV